METNTSPKNVDPAASSSSINGSPPHQRNKIILQLPDDLLAPTSEQKQIAADEQAALALQQHQQYARYSTGVGNVPNNIKGRLDITILEAKLVKNYGVTRMDPYIRLRVGHSIYETRTCYNGSKNPIWNKVFHCFLPTGVDTLQIEIYDECAFTVDEKIAWVLVPIPNTIFSGQTIEDTVPLSGKQGEGKEGVLSLVMSFTPMPGAAAMFQVPGVVQPVISNTLSGVPQVIVQSGQPPLPLPTPQPPQPLRISEDDIKQVHEMFPNVDVDVIKTILETQRGNKDRTVNTLLQMTES